MSAVVKIPQKLQAPKRFLIFAADDFAALCIPVGLGLVIGYTVTGIILGVFLFKLWTRLKGQRGLTGLVAWFYWWMPDFVNPFKSFPASHVDEWRG